MGRLAIVVVEQFRGSFDGPRRTVSQLESRHGRKTSVSTPEPASIWCAANTSVTEADPAARSFAQIPQTAVGTTRVSRTSDLGLRRRQTKVTLNRDVHRTTTWSRPLAGPWYSTMHSQAVRSPHSSRTRRHHPSKSGGLKVLQEPSWRSYDHRWSTPLICGPGCEDDGTACEVHCVWLPGKELSSYVSTFLYSHRDLEEPACWSPAHPQRWAEPSQNSASAPRSHLLKAILVGRAAWSCSERQRVCRSRVSRNTIEARTEAPSC